MGSKGGFKEAQFQGGVPRGFQEGFQRGAPRESAIRCDKKIAKGVPRGSLGLPETPRSTKRLQGAPRHSKEFQGIPRAQIFGAPRDS